jgi:hypothetical protein
MRRSVNVTNGTIIKLGYGSSDHDDSDGDNEDLKVPQWFAMAKEGSIHLTLRSRSPSDLSLWDDPYLWPPCKTFLCAFTPSWRRLLCHGWLRSMTTRSPSIYLESFVTMTLMLILCCHCNGADCNSYDHAIWSQYTFRPLASVMLL